MSRLGSELVATYVIDGERYEVHGAYEDGVTKAGEYDFYDVYCRGSELWECMNLGSPFFEVPTEIDVVELIEFRKEYSMPSMNLRAFVFSVDLLQEMITTGWEVGTTHIVRCVNGLPANAKFEYIEPSDNKEVVFVFSHPAWPKVSSVDNVPRDVITLESIPLFNRPTREEE